MRRGFPIRRLASVGLLLASVSCGDAEPAPPVATIGVETTLGESTTSTQAVETTTTTTAPPPLVADLLLVPETFRERLVELVEETQALRGMSFSESLSVEVLTSQEMTRRLRTPAGDNLDRIRLEQTLYRLLGLVDPEDDWMETAAAFGSRPTPGYYDVSSSSLWLLSTLDTPSPLEEMTLVGEIAKALLDHNLGVWERRHRLAAAGDSDFLTAMGALAEADATLVELLFAEGLPAASRQQLTEEAQTWSVGAPPLPSFVQASLRFAAGPALDYLQRLYQLGGWDLVNDAHRTPPDSTEQILVLGVDRPEPVLLSRPAVSPPAGFREVADSVWGQWGWNALLTSALGSDQAASASWGWGGDRYLLFTDSVQVALVVSYVGDTPEDTEEMRAALEEYIPSRMAVGSARPLPVGSEYYDSDYAWLGEGGEGGPLTIIASTDVELGRQLRAYLVG